MNKNALTIAAVIVFHVTVITIMVVQPGCKSDGSKIAAPEPAAAANVTAATPPTDAAQWSEPTRPPEEAPMPIAQYTPVNEPINAVNAIPATPVAESAPAKTYTIVANDYLYKIAHDHGVSVDELVAANTATHLTPTTILRPGRQIIIPAHAAMPATATTMPSAPAADEGTYKVVSRDNLTVIARKLGTTVPAIKAANNMTSDRIVAGQVLKIPSASATSAAMAPSAPAAGENEYVVQANDNPEVIARKTGVRVAEIMRLNNLTDAKARNLRPGDRLKLPPRSGIATPAPAPAMPAPAAAVVMPTPAPATVTAVPVSTGTESPPVAPVAQ